MIYRVQYRAPDRSIVTMLFGNSYKKWDEQKREWEYLESNVGLKMISISKTKQPWIAIGGLKWCDYEHFQEELNLEAKRKSTNDKKYKPRQLQDFEWMAA